MNNFKQFPPPRFLSRHRALTFGDGIPGLEDAGCPSSTGRGKGKKKTAAALALAALILTSFPFAAQAYESTITGNDNQGVEIRQNVVVSPDDNVGVSVTENAQIYGLHKTDGEAANKGSVTIEESKVDEVYGGYAKVVSSDSSTATDEDAIASATGNTVNIYDSTVTGKIYGGYAYANVTGTGSVNGETDKATATGNTVTITDGTIKGDVYGGHVGTSDSDTTNYDFDAFTGNTLKISVNAIAEGKTAYNFETIRFGAESTPST